MQARPRLIAAMDQRDWDQRRASLTGVVLAGGRARRMGGRDKGLLPVLHRPLIEYVLDALRPQVGALLINANRNREAYKRYGYPVIADRIGDFAGPLAGRTKACGGGLLGSSWRVPEREYGGRPARRRECNAAPNRQVLARV